MLASSVAVPVAAARTRLVAQPVHRDTEQEEALLDFPVRVAIQLHFGRRQRGADGGEGVGQGHREAASGPAHGVAAGVLLEDV